MKQNSKRILIISNNAFSNKFNNGKTLEAIFSWVNPNDLAQLYFNNSYEPDYKFNNQYFLISDWHVLMNCICSNSQGIQKEKKNTSDNQESTNKNNTINKFLKSSVFRLCREIIWKFGFRERYRKKMYDWISLFDPDIIFLVAGDSCFAQKITLDIVQLFKVPLFVYFTDDYTLTQSVYSIWGGLHHYLIKKCTNDVIHTSTKRFAIGEKMSEAYSIHYKNEFYPIMNLSDVPQITTPKFLNSSEIKICYFGNIGLGRCEMIFRLAQLCYINSDIRNKVSFHIYTFSSHKQFSKRKSSIIPNLFLHDGVVNEAYETAKNQSSFLLHVESDESQNIRKTKLSISTKIPEYLSSGIPIIAFGPPDIASMQLFYENNIGFYINSKSSTKDLVKSLSNLVDLYFSHSPLIKNSIVSGLDFAKIHFDRNKIINDFKSHFL